MFGRIIIVKYFLCMEYMGHRNEGIKNNEKKRQCLKFASRIKNQRTSVNLLQVMGKCVVKGILVSPSTVIIV